MQRVSDAKREKVLSAAARMDYSPNLFAKGLVAQKSNILGIIIPQRSEFAMSNPYFPQVMRGIGKIATENGYHLLISFLDGKSSREPLYKTNLVSGIIILGNLLEDPDIYELERRALPTVLIPGLLRESSLPSIDIDNVSAGFQAAEHLLQLGHRRIAFLNGIKNSKYSVQRLQGYQKAFQKYRLFYDENLIVETKFSEVGGYKKMAEILAGDNHPTAVICAADVVAIGALSAMKERNLRVPEQISVVSFGDIPLAGMLDTPLTSVRIPFIEIGQKACRLLIDWIKGESLAEKEVVFPVDLIIRQTTKAIAG
ncbi:MAG: LacI family DNA-binding transcriptional regulator [Deltaproteobacteria bacterium]|nr:LacI family DNA-binding transcriptional regulator [Deltaproteobacteria bacterium]